MFLGSAFRGTVVNNRKHAVPYPCAEINFCCIAYNFTVSHWPGNFSVLDLFSFQNEDNFNVEKYVRFVFQRLVKEKKLANNVKVEKGRKEKKPKNQ